jgi:hypothetical protein
MNSEPKTLTRDVEASVVPIGTKVTLQKGETGAHHAVARRQLHRHRQRQHVPHADKDADALGLEVTGPPAAAAPAWRPGHAGAA